MVSTAIRRAAAKKLRANTTPHERALWRALKELPIEGTHFRRQAPIGRYVVDLLLSSMAGITTTMRQRRAIAIGKRGWSSKDTGSSASGIRKLPVTLMQ